MGKKYLCGIDIGASSVRTGIVDFEGKEVGSHQIETQPIFGKGGSVTYDGPDFVSRIYETTRQAIEKSGIDPEEIAGLSFGALRSTVVAYDKDGNIAYPFVSYLDTTFVPMLEKYEKVRESLGVTVDDVYEEYGNARPSTALTIARIAQEEPEAYDRIYKHGNMSLMVGRAYGMDGFYMDRDNAHYHGFYNLSTRGPVEKVNKIWEAFGMKAEKAADPIKPTTLVGHVTQEVAEKTGLAPGTPIYMGSGDQHCNDLGVGVIKEGMFSFCLGTTGMVAMRSDKPVRDPNYKIFSTGAPFNSWIAEGACTAGAAIHKWIRNQFYAVECKAEKEGGESAFAVMDREADAVKPGSEGLLFLPWVHGSPANADSISKGGFIGLEAQHTRANVVRAFYEGVGYELSLNVRRFRKALGIEPKVIRVTGGCARSKVWMQIVSDFCNLPLEFVESKEVGTIGAAMLAGIGCGVFDSLEDAADKMVHVKDRINPDPVRAKFYQELSEVFEGIYETTDSDAYRKYNEYKMKYF